MTTQPEHIQWIPTTTSKPDADITVLCWREAETEWFSGWWDDEAGAWFDAASGGIVEGVTHWAHVQGPGAERAAPLRPPAYCWSHDGEEYHDTFATREDALAEAQARADDDWEPGEIGIVYTGEQRYAMHFLRRCEASIGEEVVERLDEWLIDDISSDDAIVDLVKEKHAAFGKHILDWLEMHASFNRWAVAEIQEHEINAAEEGGA